MLKTFNDDMILTALQELTTEQNQISVRVQKLEANKNTTETYTGTLDGLGTKLLEIAEAKWGEDGAIAGLYHALQNNDLNIDLSITLGAITVYMPITFYAVDDENMYSLQDRKSVV